MTKLKEKYYVRKNGKRYCTYRDTKIGRILTMTVRLGSYPTRHDADAALRWFISPPKPRKSKGKTKRTSVQATGVPVVG